MAKKKLTNAERAERDAFHAGVLANAQRTRALAERAQTELEAQGRAAPIATVEIEEPKVLIERALANAQRTRELAEKAQAKLDAQRQARPDSD